MLNFSISSVLAAALLLGIESWAAFIPLKTYQMTLAQCHSVSDGRDFVAIRRWSVGLDNLYLVVDPKSLETRIQNSKNLSCETITLPNLLNQKNLYVKALQLQLTSLLDPRNAGLHQRSGDHRGSFLTVDLCPSLKNIDRHIFEKVADIGGEEAVVNIAISGKWLERHELEFQWLLQKQKSGGFRLRWLNHSYTHPYIKGVADLNNFLLLPQVNFENEVLVTEQLLIRKRIAPSVFFRFPGLIANSTLMRRLSEFGLIAVGADAWLGKGQKPQAGSLILVHGNGNEPQGLKIFNRLLDNDKINQPFRDLLDYTF